MSAAGAEAQWDMGDTGVTGDARHARVPGSGLCPTCCHVRPVTSTKGSTFLRCALSDVDRDFPRYPPQPVLVCRGHER